MTGNHEKTLFRTQERLAADILQVNDIMRRMDALSHQMQSAIQVGTASSEDQKALVVFDADIRQALGNLQRCVSTSEQATEPDAIDSASRALNGLIDLWAVLLDEAENLLTSSPA